MGLASRVVAKGEALTSGQRLARELSTFPQICLRNDGESVYRQWDLSFHDALQTEFRNGIDVVKEEGRDGAGRFVAGKGRHGRFES